MDYLTPPDLLDLYTHLRSIRAVDEYSYKRMRSLSKEKTLYTQPEFRFLYTRFSLLASLNQNDSGSRLYCIPIPNSFFKIPSM